MDPKYLKNGTYGCVFRPAVGCDKQTNNSNVSKLFESKEEMKKEQKKHSNINKNIDPTNIFTLKLKEHCLIDTSSFQSKEIGKCENLRERKAKNPQLVYEYGGHDLKMATGLFDFQQIFIAANSIFKGLVIMEKKHYSHIDIKPDNIVYNNDTNKLSLIDFGIARIVENDFYKEKNKLLFDHMYPYYPPEFGMLSNFYDFGREHMLKKMRGRNLDHYNSSEFFRSIQHVVSVTTKNNELKLLLKSFQHNHDNDMGELYMFFEYALSKPDMETVLNDFVNRIDVYMFGTTLMEVLDMCIGSKKTTIKDENSKFYIDVIKLLHNMVHISPVMRYTPQQALSEYNRILQLGKGTSPVNLETKDVSKPKHVPKKKDPKCREDQEINPLTQNCRKVCLEGQIRNAISGRCVKQKNTKVPTVKVHSAKVQSVKSNECGLVDCKKLKPIPQINLPSLFIAILTVFFYSNGIRNVICKNIDKWDLSNNVSNVALDLLKNPKQYDESDIACLFDTTAVGTSLDVHIMAVKKMLETLHMYENTLIVEMLNGKAIVPDELLYSRSKEPKRPDLLICFVEGWHVPGHKKPLKYMRSGKKIGKGYARLGSFQFNEDEYIVDSYYTSNAHPSDDTSPQYIAGVTCNSKRYIYNGWNVNTKDDSFGHEKIDNKKPCGLIKYDWMNIEHEYILDKDKCTMKSMKNSADIADNDYKGIMYSMLTGDTGQQCFFAVRKDLTTKNT